MLELLFAIVIVGFAAFFIGQTISKEDIFEGTRAKLERVLYDECDEEEFHQRKKDAVYADANLIDGYRLDLPRWKAMAYGKLGDLITCPKCTGVWASFVIWTWVYNFSGELAWTWAWSIPMIAVSGAIIYILNTVRDR